MDVAFPVQEDTILTQNGRTGSRSFAFVARKWPFNWRLSGSPATHEQ
jgi:hypothetical protein